VCGLYDACVDARRSNDEDGQVIKPGPLSQKEIVDRFEAMFGPAQGGRPPLPASSSALAERKLASLLLGPDASSGPFASTADPWS
jgi:hypothetical protein